jgi:hypothetical protein
MDATIFYGATVDPVLLFIKLVYFLPPGVQQFITKMGVGVL